MIEVIALFCTLAGTCVDKQIALTDEKVTPQQCFMNGQTAAAKYLGEHPEFSTVKKITCQRLGKYAKI